MSHGQDTVFGDLIGDIWNPYEGPTRLYITSLTRALVRRLAQILFSGRVRSLEGFVHSATLVDSQVADRTMLRPGREGGTLTCWHAEGRSSIAEQLSRGQLEAGTARNGGPRHPASMLAVAGWHPSCALEPPTSSSGTAKIATFCDRPRLFMTMSIFFAVAVRVAVKLLLIMQCLG